MNYSIRNLVIAGGLAIVAIVAVLIYTSNVQTRRKGGAGAREGVSSPALTCRPALRRRTSLHGAT